MVITESELRELWRDGRNPLPTFPHGTRFTPAAQDFLKAHYLEIHFEPSPTANLQALTTSLSPEGRPPWDKPGTFPVVLSGPVPVCLVCGQPVHNKPDHLTQLDAGHFAPETHPRVRLRGRLDTLHALVMLVGAEARRCHLPRLAAHLDTLAAYCREIQSAEYHGREAQPLMVAGKTEAEIHDISHWPDQNLGMAHIVPGPHDHAIVHWLNYLRTMAREVEVVALEVYPAPAALRQAQGDRSGPGLAHALNRLSSAIYYLELLFKSGALGWKVE